MDENENKRNQDAGTEPQDDLSARIDALAAAGRRAKKAKQKRSVRQREQMDDEYSRTPDSLSGTDLPEERGLAAWLRGTAADLKQFTRTQRFRRGGTATLLTVLFIVFVVLANLVAVTLTERYAVLSPDLTKNQIYTLSDVTEELLDSLDERVEIDILASETKCMNTSVDFDPYGQVPMATELIKRYAQKSDQVKVVFIDLEQYPGYLDLVPDYRDVLYEYCIVVRSQRRTRATSFYEMLPSLSGTAVTDSTSIDVESSMTEMYISSLIKTVTIDTVPTVAYLDSLGGGEYVDYLLDALKLNGYDVLTSANFAFGYEPIPDNVQMAIISAPLYDLSQSQLIALSDFLDNDGKLGKSLLVLSSNLSPDMPNLRTLLEEWGIVYTRDTVYEGDSTKIKPTLTADSFTPICLQSAYIDENIASKTVPVAGALNIEIPRQTLAGNIVINPILSTTTQGYICPPGEIIDMNALDPAAAATRCVMAEATLYRDSEAGEDNALRSDVIVAPCSICAGDYLGSSVYGNFALMMNICNQRCGIVYADLNIESKSLTPADFSIGTTPLRWLTVIFGYLIPAAIAAAGAFVYLRRKRL